MTEAMASLDVSAALQAAVAAAAEIARVGLPDNMVVFPSSRSGETASVPVPPLAPKEHESPNPQLVRAVVVKAPSSTCSSDDHESNYHTIPEVRSFEKPTVVPDQCTGQDAAGDRDQQNDLASVTSSADAAGEKTFEESEEDAAKRLARSRERNREHARRTRLRKKAQLENLQQKVRGLEAEKKVLKQKIEECSIASILINLAEPSPEEEQQKDDTVSLLDATIKKQENTDSDAKISLLTAGKRKRFASVDKTPEENKPTQTLKLKIDGQTRTIGPKSHINWKSGVYSDENGVQRQLTSEQLESLRRERNRMHAKMTRDRKKNFIATIEKTIEELERDNQRMRDVLNQVGAHEQALAAPIAVPVTPLESPKLSASNSEERVEEIDIVQEAVAPSAVVQPPPPPVAPTAAAVSHQDTPKLEEESLAKRPKVSHGFSLDG